MNDRSTNLVILFHPDPDKLTFLLNCEIATYGRWKFQQPVLGPDESWEAVGPMGQQILTRLFAVDGVLEIEMLWHEFTVVKDSDLSWDVICVIVGSILTELFGQGIAFISRRDITLPIHA